MPADDSFADNSARSRFEYSVDGQIVFADYSRKGDRLYINHVEAPQALRGTGAAGRLMGEIVAYASAHNLEVVPVCGYAVAWLQRHGKRSAETD